MDKFPLQSQPLLIAKPEATLEAQLKLPSEAGINKAKNELTQQMYKQMEQQNQLRATLLRLNNEYAQL